MVWGGHNNHRASDYHLAIHPGSEELFGPVYSQCFNEVRGIRTARCEETYFKKWVHSQLARQQKHSWEICCEPGHCPSGASMSLGLKVEVSPREEARWSKSQSGQPVPTKVHQNGAPSHPRGVSVFAAAVTETSPASRRPPARSCCAI